MLRRVALYTCLFLLSACATDSLPATKNAKDIRLNNPFGQAYHAEPLDNGQIKVVASDFAGVSLGLCTDPEGAVQARYCTKSGAPVDVAPPKLVDLSKGTFGQYTHLKSFDSSGGISVAGVEGKSSVASAQYEIVYEWSRYKTIEAKPHELLSDAQTNVVTSADVGLAMKLVMEVSIDSVNGSVGASLGFGKLAAALEERRAQVSVRLALVGVSALVAPENAVRIDSAADLFEVLDQFNTKALALDKKLEGECSDPNACSLRPEMLAYYVRGPAIGKRLRVARRAEQRCLDARNVLAQLNKLSKLTYAQAEEKNDTVDAIDAYCEEATEEAEKLLAPGQVAPPAEAQPASTAKPAVAGGVTAVSS